MSRQPQQGVSTEAHEAHKAQYACLHGQVYPRMTVAGMQNRPLPRSVSCRKKKKGENRILHEYVSSVLDVSEVHCKCCTSILQK